MLAARPLAGALFYRALADEVRRAA